jgi:hypothetical protein
MRNNKKLFSQRQQHYVCGVCANACAGNMKWQEQLARSLRAMPANT